MLPYFYLNLLYRLFNLWSFMLIRVLDVIHPCRLTLFMQKMLRFWIPRPPPPPSAEVFVLTLVYIVTFIFLCQPLIATEQYTKCIVYIQYNILSPVVFGVRSEGFWSWSTLSLQVVLWDVWPEHAPWWDMIERVMAGMSGVSCNLLPLFCRSYPRGEDRWEPLGLSAHTPPFFCFTTKKRKIYDEKWPSSCFRLFWKHRVDEIWQKKSNESKVVQRFLCTFYLLLFIW